jgi:type II secretory pathway pseudopilin PulG
MTLLELVVVIGILAALAGLLVPKLGGILTQTGYATAASSSGDVASNLGVYYTTNAAYPANLDSLLEAASTSTLYAPVWNGPTVNGTLMDPLYTVGQPFSSGAYYMSFARAFGTTTTVMDQTASVTDPSMSGTTQRTILGTSADNFAVVNGTATTNSMTHQTTVPAIAVAAGFPNGVPTGTILIAMGVGPGCAAIGNTMTTAPRCSTPSGNTTYSRYIAIFALYSNGNPATLQTVVDSLGSSTDTNITNYKGLQTNAM